MNPKELRYQPESYVPGHKGSKHTCPGCEKPKQFTRYVDTRTDELLPDVYGICNNRDNCGYNINPYHKGQSGLSYANEVYEAERENRPVETRTFQKLPTPQPSKQKPATAKIYSYPSDIVTPTLNHYERNSFARLLWWYFGRREGNELLKRFHIGTVDQWKGACIFWVTDEIGRVRSGQVVLFDEHGHTAKCQDKEGNTKRCTTWIHKVLKQDYKKNKQPLPDWLAPYTDELINAPKWPVPFGLHRLSTAPKDQPIAIVEAPKTAVICSGHFPQFVWLAVGALDWLTLDRITPLRNRKIRLFPDASKTGTAYSKWSAKAKAFNEQGFSISVDTTLEQVAPLTDKQRANGYDMADYLLDNWCGFPPITYTVPIDQCQHL